MKICDYCSKPIILPHQGTQRFCSPACSIAWHQEHIRQAKAFFEKEGQKVVIEREGEASAA
jgi:hypothetical protein